MMTLKASFEGLLEKLEVLRFNLEEHLQWDVTEAKPLREDHVLVSRYDDATSKLTGLIEEAKAAAEEGRRAASGQIDLAAVRLALIACQERCLQASQQFFSELASFEAIKDLESLGRERKGEWLKWTNGVKDALDRCRQPIDDVNQVLFQCWQELSERASLVSVSVKSTGQQVNLPRESVRESDVST